MAENKEENISSKNDDATDSDINRKLQTQSKEGRDSIDLESDTETPKEAELIRENVKSQRQARKKKKTSAKDLLKALWADKRSWKKRILVAALASLSFTFTLLVYGPLEIYLSNVQYYTYSPMALVKPVLIVGGIVLAAMTLILMLLRGKVFNTAVTIVFWTTVSSYVQSFLPSNKLGPLDGTRIEWETMVKPMFSNLLIWSGILIALFILLYFSKKVWRRGIAFGCVLMLVMQGAGLVHVISTHDFENSSTDGYLSNSTAYEVSGKKNTIVFLIDRCGYTTLNSVFDKYPELKDGFTDFKNYDNALGSYSRTFPSVVYLLTGVKCEYKEPINDYFARAWKEGTFIPDIKKAGYNVKLYTEMNYVIKNTSNIDGIVDNIGGISVEPKAEDILKKQYPLSMYRYMPLALKPFFWSYSGDLDKISASGNANDVYTTDDAVLFQGLLNNGLSVDDGSEGSFIFYHMKGAHEPFNMDYDGNFRYTDAYQQTGGDLNFILHYVEMLKEKGLYDDTTIIVTADHGNTGTLTELSESVSMGAPHNHRSIALLVKPAGASSDKPLETISAPVTHDNIRSYILKSMGIDYSGYSAKPIDEISDEDTTPRYFYMSGCDEAYAKRDYNLITYEIVGDVKNFDNWNKVSTEKIKYPFYDAD